MPIAPTQAERGAALARLREYIQDPDRVLLRLADLQVLLNPNAQSVAIAAANEDLQGQVAAARLAAVTETLRTANLGALVSPTKE